jgi:hypothetical protein
VYETEEDQKLLDVLHNFIQNQLSMIRDYSVQQRALVFQVIKLLVSQQVGSICYYVNISQPLSDKVFWDTFPSLLSIVRDIRAKKVPALDDATKENAFQVLVEYPP